MQVSSAATIERRRSGEHLVFTEPAPKRVRVRFGGEWIADSRRALLLHETGHTPVYYFPRDDVRMDLLRPSEHRTHCPYKGDAAYWHARVGDRVAEDAVWAYPDPLEEQRVLKDYVAFYWDRMDQWFEEDDEVFVHPKDPYKRIDVLHSSRHVRVMLGGEVVAESHRARLLFETGLPVRYYLPQTDVRLDLLEPSDQITRCPYKGEARYWSVRVGDRVFKDICWSYPYPNPEVARIQGLLCFFNERVEELWVDGEREEAPKTRWS
jgi:uncharacterized protein (DUF427 family)